MKQIKKLKRIILMKELIEAISIEDIIKNDIIDPTIEDMKKIMKTGKSSIINSDDDGEGL